VFDTPPQGGEGWGFLLVRRGGGEGMGVLGAGRICALHPGGKITGGGWGTGSTSAGGRPERPCVAQTRHAERATRPTCGGNSRWEKRPKRQGGTHPTGAGSPRPEGGEKTGCVFQFWGMQSVPKILKLPGELGQHGRRPSIAPFSRFYQGERLNRSATIDEKKARARADLRAKGAAAREPLRSD